MRLLHYSLAGGPIRVGLLLPNERQIVDLQADVVSQAGRPWPNSIDALLADGRLAELVGSETPADATAIDLDSVRVHSPLLTPPKIIGVGMNYADHAAEVGAELPEEPVFFSKFANTLVGSGDPIVLPVESTKIDWEAELVAVIGKAGRNISASDALDYVAGYSVGNDVTARDWQMQKPMRQWLLGKTFDTFLPLGPYLVTRDEVEDPQALHITCEISQVDAGGESSEIVQDALTKLHFDVPALIAYLSRVVTLEPGDLILTGTPGGVGMSRSPRRYLKDGEVLITSIKGLGTLRNPVVSSQTAHLSGSG